jgi:hypothetical protein
MEINVTYIGYFAIFWLPTYSWLLYLVMRRSNMPTSYGVIGIIMMPFIPLALIYLALLVYLREKRGMLDQQTNIVK